MKRILALVLMLSLLIVPCAFAEDGALAGGWTLCDPAEPIPEEALAAFDKAMEGLVGVSYEPAALLSTQVVAGLNYCFLCKAQVIVPDAQPYWAYVYVYADLEGDAAVTSIGAISPEIAE